VRLFFAIELPAEVRAGLGRLRLEDPAYRWVEPAMMHVTLAFLGEQPETALESLERVGAAAAANARPLSLRVGEAGSFGSRSAPSVLWTGLAGDVPALQRLQHDLAARLKQAGVALEDRAWQPHITLARRRGHASGGKVAWPPANVPAASFVQHRLVLFQSKLSPKGATYVALREFQFGD
jgi:2'-5' RNA ligase